MINPKLLPEGAWVEEFNGAYIIRSKFYAEPHTIEEIMEYALSDKTSLERVVKQLIELTSDNQ